MCISAAIMAAGTVLTLSQQETELQTAENAMNYNLALADQNKIMIDDQTEFAVGRHVDSVQRVLGSQRAGYGAAGVTMEGTPTNVAIDSATQGEIDRLAIKYGGEVKQANVDSQKATTRFKGQSIEAQGELAMMQTVLGGADKAEKGGYFN